jgi:hypothetical protein
MTEMTTFTFEQERRFFAALGIPWSVRRVLSGAELVDAAERQSRELEQSRAQVRKLEAHGRRLEAEASGLKELKSELSALRRDRRLESARAQVAAEDAAAKEATEGEWLASFRQDV